MQRVRYGDLIKPSSKAEGFLVVNSRGQGRLTQAGYGCNLLRMVAPDRITRNPAVMGGKPCIRNLRITVGTVAGLVAAGKTRDQILKLYPHLEADDIAAALTYAAWRSEEQEVDLQHG